MDFPRDFDDNIVSRGPLYDRGYTHAQLLFVSHQRKLQFHCDCDNNTNNN